MGSFIFIIVMATVFVGLGWPVIKRIDAGGYLSLPETGAFAFAVGSLALYFGVFLIGSYRLDSLSMWSLFILMVFSSIYGWRTILLRAQIRKFMNFFKSTSINSYTSCLWVVILLVSFSSLVQGMAPPNDYDALMYHLAIPKYDVERGFISIPWDRAIAQILFPQFGGHISRFSLVTMNDGVAQMMHGLFGLLASVATGLIIRRLGFDLNTALLGSLLFLISRVVIWQMGTVETDVPLAAFSALAMLAYLIFRENGCTRLMVIFGLMIGSAILFKLLGFAVALAFVPLLVSDFINKKIPLNALMLGPIIALVVIIPHLIQTFNLSGNPLYPLFSDYMSPNAAETFTGVEKNLGTGRGIIDFVISPWTISILPMHYYDGMVFGSPYILAFAPLAFLRKENFFNWLHLLFFMSLYFALWFWTFGQQTRFLLPLLPFLCGLAAVGLSILWDMSLSSVTRKIVVIVVFVAIGFNQFIFVGIYSLIRVPAALGLVDTETYLEETPSMTRTFYGSCSFISENLGPKEQYLSLTGSFHSYYCPQAQVVRNYFLDESKWWLSAKKPPHMKRQEFIKRFEQSKFRYVLVSWAYETRRDRQKPEGYTKLKNIAAKPIVFTTGTDSRFSEYLDPAISGLDPVFRGPMTAVYDGSSVLAALRQLK